MTTYQQKLLSDDATIVENINAFRKSVSSKEADYITKNIADFFENDMIFIPPYQRPLVWTEVMQSRFIESLLLELPIPYVFLCQNNDGRQEVVDGAQRLQTVNRFLKDELRLRGLEKLTALNDMYFSDLPASERRKFHTLSLKVIIFNDRTDDDTRFDIFKRLNTGGLQLTDSQIRAGALKGRFYELIMQCASDEDFKKMAMMLGKKDPAGDRAELVTRYFAYAERYMEFRHDVRAFLDDFVEQKNKDKSVDLDAYRRSFHEMLDYVANVFPHGFRKSPNSFEIPRVRFEAISVGTHLAIKSGRLNPIPNFAWLESDDFKKHCRTDASNSATRLRGRVEYVRDRLIL